MSYRSRKAVCIVALFAATILLCLPCSAAPVQTDDPTAFFNTVAGRLLKSELNADLNRIEIYPTNRYTAALHRLLQVSANIYESITNKLGTEYPFLPHVYRPLFTNDSGRVFICGYVEETGTNYLALQLRDLTRQTDRADIRRDDRVLGVPLIIGVQKGYPNFNQLAGQTCITIGRRLEFLRDGTPRINATNVMYFLSVSNVYGVEAFNAYTNNFPRDLRMRTSLGVELVITNEQDGVGSVLASNKAVLSELLEIPGGSWAGYTAGSRSGPYLLLPISNSWVSIPLSAYSSELKQLLEGEIHEFERGSFGVPRWGAEWRVTLDYALIDAAGGAIVDYVSLDCGRHSADLTSLLMQETIETFSACGPSLSGTRSTFWCTNIVDYISLWQTNRQTMGILNQISVGLGDVSSPIFSVVTNKEAIDFFRYQFGLSPRYGNTAYILTNRFYCPVTPLRAIYLFTELSANDPLVHSTLDELRLPTPRPVDFTSNYSTLSGLGFINPRYAPWSERFQSILQGDARLVDPQIRSADDWDFPAYQVPALSWISRVHRGTPWQTIYWKAGSVNSATWRKWIYENPLADMPLQTMPTNDCHLIEPLASLFSQDFPRGATSMNLSGVAQWAALMDGFTVYTNSTVTVPEALILEETSTQAQSIGSALVAAKANIPGGRFRNFGDLLSVPELSTGSPFIGPGISTKVPPDYVLEAIPSQLVGLLRADSIGSMQPTPLSVSFSGIDGYNYLIESSSDLRSWRPVATNVAVAGKVEYGLPTPPKNQEFYRSELIE